MDPHVAANRANWDDRVPVHLASSSYDVDGWLASRRGPRPEELEALGDVDGLDLVHLQCHFGIDTLSFARAGARVTGLDFSPAAISATDALAPETYDIVYVSLGALCWLPSITQWAMQVAALLRPGGRLYLHDVHPLTLALADDDLRVEYSYFEESQPASYDDDATYTDGQGRLVNTRTYQWNHALGEIVTALLTQGLHLDKLVEHDWTMWPRFSWLIGTADHRWQSPSGKPRVPLSFTLLASRPTSRDHQPTAPSTSSRSRSAWPL